MPREKKTNKNAPAFKRVFSAFKPSNAFPKREKRGFLFPWWVLGMIWVSYPIPKKKLGTDVFNQYMHTILCLLSKINLFRFPDIWGDVSTNASKCECSFCLN
jgi:hypothetical protein